MACQANLHERLSKLTLQIQLKVGFVDLVLVNTKVAEGNALAAMAENLHYGFDRDLCAAKLVAVSFAEGMGTEIA
jgi:hypothetical protein